MCFEIIFAMLLTCYRIQVHIIQLDSNSIHMHLKVLDKAIMVSYLEVFCSINDKKFNFPSYKL